MAAFWLSLLAVVFIIVLCAITGFDTATFIASIAMYAAIRANIERHGAGE